MTYSILLVSVDSGLEARVRRALPGSVPAELVVAADYQPAGGAQDWLLVLLDARAAPSGSPTAAWLRQPPALPSPCGPPPPLLWLGQRPQITGGCGERFGCHIPAVDFLDRDLAPPKLAFILHQHLAVAYLRRQRAPAVARDGTGRPRLAGGAELCRQVNNALTGILGNVDLVLEANRRLPPPMQLRLQRVSAIASQMRDVMLSVTVVGE